MILGLSTLFNEPAHLILMQATRFQGKRFAVCSAYGKTLPRPARNANRSKNTPSREERNRVGELDRRLGVSTRRV